MNKFSKLGAAAISSPGSSAASPLAGAPASPIGADQRLLDSGGRSLSPTGGAGAPNASTYEHVSLDDYTSTECPDCDDGEVSFIALDSVRYELGECPTCDGTHKVARYCQCGEPVTGGSDDGDNSVCHSCNLVFHRGEQLEGWGLAEASWAMPQAARAFALRVEPSCTVSPADAASIAIAKEARQ